MFFEFFIWISITWLHVQLSTPRSLIFYYIDLFLDYSKDLQASYYVHDEVELKLFIDMGN
jgi:hypothetical protein